MRRLLALTVVLLIALLFPPLAVATQEAPGHAVGVLLVGLSPILETLLVSGLTYAANTGLGLIKDWSNLAKYVFMGVVGVVVSWGVAALGHAIPSDAGAWTALTAAGIAKALVAAVVYKIGKAAG